MSSPVSARLAGATTPTSTALFSFDNRYARLPERFYARLDPTPVASPSLVVLNDELAESLGLDAGRLRAGEGAEILSGNRVPEGAEPLAQAYAGHQFGHFTVLGDGRALLLGEVRDASGAVRDIQLKGSGPTPFSRRGDGRASLGPVLREYLIAEAMHALGVPTTRALAAVLTGEPVFRQSTERGAILTRVASSHVRVGTFQYFAAQDDVEALRALVEFCIERHQPESAGDRRPALALLRGTMQRQAELVARWLGIGFIHGVMNTDNTSISGETIDYGPCAFMDTYDPAAVFSSIDHMGRYAFGAQPAIIGWNMGRLAEALLPVIDEDHERAVAAAQELADGFASVMGQAWLEVMRAKLGLMRTREGDRELIMGFLGSLARGQADFTNAFRALCDDVEAGQVFASVRAELSDATLLDTFAPMYRARLADDAPLEGPERAARMRSANPAYTPRNHRVEAALQAAIEDDDLGPFEELLKVLRRPYDDQPEAAELREPPQRGFQQSYRTFCGT